MNNIKLMTCQIEKVVNYDIVYNSLFERFLIKSGQAIITNSKTQTIVNSFVAKEKIIKQHIALS